VWVTRRGTDRARQALEVLRGASDHGLAPEDYGEPEVARRLDALDQAVKKDDKPDPRQIAELDVRITSGLLELGHDVALGHSSPESINPRAKGRRTAPDLSATLAAAADRNLKRWLQSIQPRYSEYAQLQRALRDLRAAPSNSESQDRIRQIGANLERWRWLPDDLGARHFLVNIPTYNLVAREDGRIVLTSRVVVGKTTNKTPVFSSAMTTVVFSPYWNIPDSIVAGETAPAVAKDSKYLARHNIEILRVSKSGADVVDPSDVDWDDADELKSLAFRQKPGSENALGHVKFLFPNDFDVYIHDTPADELFARPNRAFSHGCVRVAEPEAIASYVLRGDAEWNQERIRQALNAGVEKQVKLAQPIPVHIVYFTAWVDDAGQVHFENDVYGYDRIGL
jgi:murein L,D-transpeptidase YcbB/YkuD